MPNRRDVVEEARSWIGTKWTHQGRTRHGIDCAGLVVVVARKFGFSDYDAKGYQRRTQGTVFLKHFKDHMKQKSVRDAKPGDVMLFRDDAYPCHATIIGEREGNLTIIHALSTARKVREEELEQGDWMNLRIGCFEFEGIED